MLYNHLKNYMNIYDFFLLFILSLNPLNYLFLFDLSSLFLNKNLTFVSKLLIIKNNIISQFKLFMINLKYNLCTEIYLFIIHFNYNIIYIY